jgi:transcriptional regulator with XRE-family HTH domain
MRAVNPKPQDMTTLAWPRLSQNPPVSLEDLAGRLANRGIQIDRSAIGRIENRNRYVLDYELKALAAALRVPIEELFK